MLDVEQAIREVGSVYQALTGRNIEAGRTELPPEIDAKAYIENRYRQLKSILESPEKAGAAGAFAPAWAPPMEVVELEREVRYEIDLPGVSRDQVSVSVVGDWLVVRGRRGGVPAPGANVRYSERGSGAFQRVVALPPRARRDAVSSTLKDGVLVVGIPTDGPAATAQPVDVK
jgi:HSP20 family protein